MKNKKTIAGAERKQRGNKEELTELRVKVSPRGVHPGIALLKQLREKNALDGIHGTVEELIKVEPEYVIAMEASSGQRLNYVVVDSVDVAAKAIDHLKKQNAGRCTFIPLDREFSAASDAVKELEKREGVHGLLIDLVQFSPKVYGAMRFVFGDTLVVENIETAKEIGIGKARMVTLDGDLLEKSGIVTGGSFKSELKSRLIEESERARKELERKNKMLMQEEKDRAFRLSSVSYEFRSKLTAIRGYSQLLYDEISGKLNPKQKNQLRIICTNATRLNVMIDSLPDLLRYERRKTRSKFKSGKSSKKRKGDKDG